MKRPVRSTSPVRGAHVASSPVAAGFRPAGTAMAVASALLALPAFAQPTGVQPLVGSASLLQQGNNLLVTTRNGAGGLSVLNWQSFSVPPGSLTQFVQPSTSSLSINRVQGNDPSRIFGTLISNGRLVLVNPAGITVGAGAVVDTAGFTASTLRMKDADALAGRLVFGDGGLAGGLAINGQVLARHGDVVLIAPSVETGANALVQAAGSTVLAAGRKVEITGRGLEGIVLQVQAPTDRAVNLGTLQGDAVGIFAGTLRHSGIIRAQTAALDGGRVVLRSQGDLDLGATAKVLADGAEGLATSTGGRIELLGRDVRVASGAHLDVSGDAAGGVLLVGGDFRGGNPGAPSALNTSVASGATLVADARQSGDGGKVVVWSTGATDVHGRLSARGGALAGSGGVVETSGHFLDVGGIELDASAPKGRGGIWLLDPLDITVVAGTGSSNNSGAPGFVPSGGSSQIGADLIAAQLNSGTSVTLDTTAGGSDTGNILIGSAIAKTGGANATLTLNAHNNINVNASITSSAGQLSMVLNANQDNVGGGAIKLGTATLDANGGSINATGKDVAISSGTATINSPFDIGKLNMSGGTLAGTGAVTVTSALTWSGGVITGSGTLTTPVGSTTALSGNTALQGSRVWNNFGSVDYTPTIFTTFQVDDTTVGGTAMFNNKPGALFDIRGTNNTTITGVGTINNQGEWRKTLNGSPFLTVIAPVFNNLSGGVVNVNSGSMQLAGDGTDAGASTYNVASGTTLRFASNSRSIASNIAGAGNVIFEGGGKTHTVTGDYNISGITTADYDTFSPSTLTFTGSVTNLGTSYVQNGGAGTVSFTAASGQAAGFANLTDLT
ncbi:MAG: filamentous hemagglutinin N-terminal domain-containing protein, partial [Ramlibacter sp.]|nr:filamentous hemagglutinin N-terminal domain-containing protein [Ramlibacter sp.]